MLNTNIVSSMAHIALWDIVLKVQWTELGSRDKSNRRVIPGHLCFVSILFSLEPINTSLKRGWPIFRSSDLSDNHLHIFLEHGMLWGYENFDVY